MLQADQAARGNENGLDDKYCDAIGVRDMRTGLMMTVGMIAVAAGAAALVWAKPDAVAPLIQMVTGRDHSAPAATPRVAASAPAAGGSRRDANAPVVVEVAPARQAVASGDIRAVGSLQSDEAVQIASEIAGRVSTIPFNEGQPVKSGDIIVRLDEALAKADLADAKARLALADANNDRARTLARTGTVTGRTRDEALSNFETANAAVELAQTRLSKHTLVAPFDGVAGTRSVSIGAFIPIGSPIVNIEKIDALKVDFKLPEVYLAQIKVGQKLDVTVDAFPDQTFGGEIYAINPLVDVNGRALQIRARLPNDGLVLRPGLFARITVKGLTSREVTLIPESAVVPRGGESVVFRIDNGKAIEAVVKLGERKDAEVEILEGLDPKATVVIAGQQKLRNGSSIEVLTTGAVPAKAALSVGRSG